MRKLLMFTAFMITGVIIGQTRTVTPPVTPTNPPGFQEIVKDRLDDLDRTPITCEGCSVDQIATRSVPFSYFDRVSKVDISQVGDGNEAYGEQQGRLQYSEIKQNSTGESVGNYARTVQVGSTPFGGGYFNKAFIDQTGGNNAGDIYQYGAFHQAEQLVTGDNNNAEVDQTGLAQKSKQTQDGDDNDAKIVQAGTSFFPPYNRAIQTQVGDMNSAYINQRGRNNGAQQNQTGDHNFATAIQDGQNNVSLETQTTTSTIGGVQACNISTVNQVGDNNESCVTQTAEQYQNCSLVNQLGNSNNAEVMQTATLSSNASCVLQFGDMNKAVVSQTGN